jgi:hypothetical protein
LSAGCYYLAGKVSCLSNTHSVLSPSGKSGNLAVTPSIIQGVCIGPTAFLAMILDLQPVHKTTKFSKFADELNIFIPGSLVLNGVVELINILEWAHNGINSLLTCLHRKEFFCANLGVNVSPPAVICNIEQVKELKLRRV